MLQARTHFLRFDSSSRFSTSNCSSYARTFHCPIIVNVISPIETSAAVAPRTHVALTVCPQQFPPQSSAIPTSALVKAASTPLVCTYQAQTLDHEKFQPQLSLLLVIPLLPIHTFSANTYHTCLYFQSQPLSSTKHRHPTVTMRVAALAVGTLGLAGFTAGAAINSDLAVPPTSAQLPGGGYRPVVAYAAQPVETKAPITSTNGHGHTCMSGDFCSCRQVAQHSETSEITGIPMPTYSSSTTANATDSEVLSRPNMSTTTTKECATHTKREVRDAEPTVTTFSSCSSGYSAVPSTGYAVTCSYWRCGMSSCTDCVNGCQGCKATSSWPTSSCSAVGCKDGEYLKPTFTGKYSCTTTEEPVTRSNRFVAQFAQATIITTTTQTTNDLGGRSLRFVARFAEVPTAANPTITSLSKSSVRARDGPFFKCSRSNRHVD